MLTAIDYLHYIGYLAIIIIVTLFGCRIGLFNVLGTFVNYRYERSIYYHCHKKKASSVVTHTICANIIHLGSRDDSTPKTIAPLIPSKNHSVPHHPVIISYGFCLFVLFPRRELSMEGPVIKELQKKEMKYLFYGQIFQCASLVHHLRASMPLAIGEVQIRITSYSHLIFDSLLFFLF